MARHKDAALLDKPAVAPSRGLFRPGLHERLTATTVTRSTPWRLVLYRAFVYNHHLDWRDPKADRARAAYDIFHPLDGEFASNVIVQIKEGTIDFQALEPVSPLFAGLRAISQALEVEVTQEYTGQQRHLVYLAPMWKQVLDFDLRADGRSTPVKEILAGKAFHRPLGGMVAVSGVGRDNWLGSPIAMANLYAFGRLAWDPNLTAEQIAEEWIRQTIGNDPASRLTVTRMLMQSWPAYVNYTGPLGMQTLTDITGSHYGPNIESSERNGWGQWHRADHEGVGMDRTVASGTGFIGQYPPQVAKMYETLATTPDNLLLFFHHVPYTYKLHDGETVIQYIYDSHYQGAAQAAQPRHRVVNRSKAASILRSTRTFSPVSSTRPATPSSGATPSCSIFSRRAAFPMTQGRAGHYPGRLEAEDARLTGYKVIAITPWEDASGGKAVTCAEARLLRRVDLRRPRRPLQHRRPVLRPPGRHSPFHPPSRKPPHRLMASRCGLAGNPFQRRQLHPPHRSRRRPQARRPHSHRRNSRRPRPRRPRLRRSRAHGPSLPRNGTV